MRAERRSVFGPSRRRENGRACAGKGRSGVGRRGGLILPDMALVALQRSCNSDSVARWTPATVDTNGRRPSRFFGRPPFGAECRVTPHAELTRRRSDRWYPGLALLGVVVRALFCAGAIDSGRASVMMPTVHHRPSRLLHMGRFADGSRQGKIRLLVGLRVELQCRTPVLTSGLVYFMHNRLDRMVWTPDARCYQPRLVAHLERRDGIPPGALDRRHIEPKDVPGLERTAHMKLDVAAGVMARDTSAFVRLAEFANFGIPLRRDQTKAFGWF